MKVGARGRYQRGLLKDGSVAVEREQHAAQRLDADKGYRDEKRFRNQNIERGDRMKIATIPSKTNFEKIKNK